MPRLTIDGIAVEVEAGATLLDAARRVGVEIPALCHVPGVCAQTSCMICVVKETVSGRVLPSCSARAEDGMIVETRNEEIDTARREVLELLMSEHVGDCEAPCRYICPAALDIPRMMAQMAVGDYEGAGRLAREHLAIPATLGYVCTAPCERGCHRAAKDSALLIRETHRIAAKEALESGDTPVVPATGKRIAIVGASAAGLAAAYVLRRRGHACRVFDKADELGRMVREYGEDELDPSVLDAEIELIRRMGVEFERGCEVGEDIRLDHLIAGHDAVVVTCDELEADHDGVFHAVEYAMAVTAVAEGKAAASQADRYVRGLSCDRLPRAYNSRLGTLRPRELGAFLTRIDPSEGARRQLLEALLRTAYGPAPGRRRPEPQARVMENPQAEAARCMQCQCQKPTTCKLRKYATEYAPRPEVFRWAERADVEPAQRFGDIVFEPGKCIRCGICVEIGRQSGASFGLTFSDRGYDVRIRVPFEQSLAEALKKNGLRCVEACPTGALALRQGEADES